MTGVQNRAPRQGRIQLEDLSFFNEGEWLVFLQRYSLQWQTIKNGAAVLSARASGVDTSPFYIGMTVPEGRKLILFYRTLFITEGDYDIDAVTAADGFTGGDEGIKAPLHDQAESVVQTSVYTNVTPVGDITERYYGMEDTGTGVGDARNGGASGIDGVLQVYTGQPMLRITRLSSEPYRFVIKLIVWEDEA